MYSYVPLRGSNKYKKKDDHDLNESLPLNERSPPPIRPTQGGPVITHIHLTMILLMIIVMTMIRITMIGKKGFY